MTWGGFLYVMVVVPISAGIVEAQSLGILSAFQKLTDPCCGLQRGLAPRVFEHIFKRIAEEEDNAVSDIIIVRLLLLDYICLTAAASKCC